MSIVSNEVTEEYAEGLYRLIDLRDSITKDKVLSQAKKDLIVFDQILTQSKISFFNSGKIVGLKELLEDPFVSVSAKKIIANKVFYEETSYIHTFNLLLLLIDRNRIEFIQGIIRNFFDLLHKRTSTEIIQLRVFKYCKNEETSLLRALSHFIPNGKYKVAVKDDPQLLGGYVAIVGSSIVDFSVLHNFKQMQNALRKNKAYRWKYWSILRS